MDDPTFDAQFKIKSHTVIDDDDYNDYIGANFDEGESLTCK